MCSSLHNKSGQDLAQVYQPTSTGINGPQDPGGCVKLDELLIHFFPGALGKFESKYPW